MKYSNNSIQYKIISNKYDLCKNGINDSTVISFLETSLKDLIEYMLIFTDVNYDKMLSSKNICNIFSSIRRNRARATLSFDKVVEIIKYYRLEVSNYKWLEGIYSSRNLLSHTNSKTSYKEENTNRANYFKIFNIINDIKMRILL